MTWAPSTLSGWLRSLFYSSYIWDMICAFLGWGGGSRFPLMQPLTMASMKEIREEARGSPERKGACSFSSSMRLRRLEGSSHKGLLKRAPLIQSPGFPRPLTTCSRPEGHACTMCQLPFSITFPPQAWTQICKDPKGSPARSDWLQPGNPGQQVQPASPCQLKDLMYANAGPRGLRTMQHP